MSLGKTYKQHTLVETSETLSRVAIKLLLLLLLLKEPEDVVQRCYH